ncbi:MAG: hypothetical protein RPU52_02365 [Candidatus Sedimenticola sp. (ex Thyasira tokunagai)]
MNIYFLVEGKTERKVYPKWISYFVPALSRINSPTEALKNSYYLISGGGFPSILDNHFTDSVNDVNSVGNYDFLVIVIDTDNVSETQKREEVFEYIHTNNISLINCELVIIPQVVCMETWLLGNRRIYARNSSNIEVTAYSQHYDVANNDPELMGVSNDYSGTIGDFHYQYLKAMLHEKNIRYSKTRPKDVGRTHYINELEARLENDPNSLNSMRCLFSFLEKIAVGVNA